MNDPMKFESLFQFHMFTIAFIAILLLEATIVIVTHQTSKQAKKQDKGTRGLLMFCYAACIYISVFMVSHSVPIEIRRMTCKSWVAWIGIGMIWAGIIIRLLAVRTLKKGFTVNVQTTKTQKLITTGMYKKVRNPSYTGSILSLLGVATAYRSILAMVVVLVLSIGCYWIRIRIEERAMEERFGVEYLEYEKRTSRLVPYVW